MTEGRRSSAALLLFAAVLAAIPERAGVAGEGRLLGMFGDWGAQTFVERGKTGCSMWSRPKKKEGRYKKRGEVFAYVTHRPWAKRLNEVSFSIGYTFKKDSEVKVTIGKRTFVLFTDGGSAWTREAKDDRALVAAMRRGVTMVVRGISSRGTRTTDTYSLKGFTKAHNAINKACKVKWRAPR